MKAWLFAIGLLAGVATLPASTFGQQAEKPDEPGTVLCAWSFYASFYRIGHECHIEGSEAFQSVLGDVVKQMEDFIYRNSDITDRELARRRQKLLPGVTNICEPEMIGDYKQLMGVGGQRVQAAISELLEVDRPPDAGPCL